MTPRTERRMPMLKITKIEEPTLPTLSLTKGS